MSSKNNIVLYEIYPRSFQDSNADGYGDLPGIISRLDYFKELGVNALWLTPFYPSPMKDVGYDIKDYCNIDPGFGTLEDFKTLIKQAHERDIKIVTDLVFNHTSDKHPWFMQSRSSRDNPKRDWYIWKDPIDGKAPNNWKSVFDPSAWEFDEKTGQYYFHAFLKEQPDLNWANPEVMEAIKDICRFWLDLGVDGFRLDAVNYLWKDQAFKDEPINPDYNPQKQSPFYQLKHIYMQDQDHMYDLVNEICNHIVAYKKDTILIVEAYPDKRTIDAIPAYKKYYERGKKSGVMPFNMEFIYLSWDAKAYAQYVSTYITQISSLGPPIYVLGNHDRARVATRLEQDQAKISAVLQLTLPGLPVIYYGEELGMQNVKIPPEMIHDTKEYRSPGFGRDPVRTPMQWDDSEFAGFSTVSPWLPLEDEFKRRNVSTEKADPQSMFSLYKKLLALRSETESVLMNGDYKVWDTGCPEVFAFTRSYKDQTLLVVLNFSDKEQLCNLPDGALRQCISTTKERPLSISKTILLLPNEAVVLEG
jgi:alpha-glucosidase